MGVKECARNECENIMCDRYSNEYGYICNECYEELVSKAVVNDAVSILEFMSSIKKSSFGADHIRELLNREFENNAN